MRVETHSKDELSLYAGLVEPTSNGKSRNATMTSPALAIKGVLKGILVIVAGALMILPAYLNYLTFSRLHFELVVSLSISIILFALGIVIFILVMGNEALERKQ